MHTATATRHVLAKPHTPCANSGTLVREMHATAVTYVCTATDGPPMRWHGQIHTNTYVHPLQSYMERKHG